MFCGLDERFESGLGDIVFLAAKIQEFGLLAIMVAALGMLCLAAFRRSTLRVANFRSTLAL